MTYCISDLHGCADKYRLLLKKIDLQPTDTLYVLGDCVDRGEHGIEILLDIAERENVVLLMGNHDYIADALLSYLGKPLPAHVDKKTVDSMFHDWYRDGGGPTCREYRSLTKTERMKVHDLINNAKYHLEITVGGKTFHLSHTLPPRRLWKQERKHAGGLSQLSYIEGEAEYESVYDESMIFVTGHVPTGLIDPASKGLIWKKNHHIAIDCGAVFGNPLGCICLDTMEEIYIV